MIKRYRSRLLHKKLLPSFVITESDVNWFLKSFEDVLEMAHEFPGSMWDVGTKLTKAAVTQSLR